MRGLLAALALVAASAGAQEPAVTPRARIERTVADSGFAGVFAVSEGGRRIAGGAVGEAAPGQPFHYDMVFPWMSVTEQAVATMVMQDVEDRRVALDAPASRYLRELGGGPRSPTVRELLQHRSGLRDPAESPADATGRPSFYTGGPTGIEWCLGGRTAPGGPSRDNDCDYLVLGGILERVNGRPLGELFATRIAGAVGARTRFVGTPVGLDADTVWAGGPGIAYSQALARHGSAGALIGTAEDMLAFDGALLSGALLTDRARAEMWRGDPGRDFRALGQRSFTASLAGCAEPVRVIERQGAIGDFQVRNLIAPDRGVAAVLLTNRPTFDFGEIRRGAGLSHDLLASALCPA